jgi:hypothetical protein
MATGTNEVLGVAPCSIEDCSKKCPNVCVHGYLNSLKSRLARETALQERLVWVRLGIFPFVYGNRAALFYGFHSRAQAARFSHSISSEEDVNLSEAFWDGSRCVIVPIEDPSTEAWSKTLSVINTAL